MQVEAEYSPEPSRVEPSSSPGRGGQADASLYQDGNRHSLQQSAIARELLLPLDMTRSVGNNIILQYIALFEVYYISTILRIAILY